VLTSKIGNEKSHFSGLEQELSSRMTKMNDPWESLKEFHIALTAALLILIKSFREGCSCSFKYPFVVFNDGDFSEITEGLDRTNYRFPFEDKLCCIT